MNSKAQMLSMALLSLYISCMLLLFISNIWPLSTSVMLLHPSNPIVSEDIYILFPLKPYDNGLIPYRSFNKYKLSSLCITRLYAAGIFFY